MTPKHPRHPNQLAEAIIDIATGEGSDLPPQESKNPAAIKRGRKGRFSWRESSSRQMSAAERKASALRLFVLGGLVLANFFASPRKHSSFHLDWSGFFGRRLFGIVCL